MKLNGMMCAGVAALTIGLALDAKGMEMVVMDEVYNHYPWDGKVDCVCTLSGLVDFGLYEGLYTLSVRQGGATVRKTVTNVFANAFGSADGTYTNTFDCVALFGEGLYPNGGVVVSLVRKGLGGVQLWENGPYWAECNVGAARPEECGYYFWWGDTVGYRRNSDNDGWVSSKDGTTTFSFLPANCSTSGKTIDELKSAGYIDSASNNLVAMHDAAVAHLGAPWRLPTDVEMRDLVDKCTSSWTNNWNGTGVSGRVVTGKGDYASKSIFLPVAGFGCESNIINADVYGYCWSSTPYLDYPNVTSAWVIYYLDNIMTADDVVKDIFNRSLGLSVRPVRGSDK